MEEEEKIVEEEEEKVAKEEVVPDEEAEKLAEDENKLNAEKMKRARAEVRALCLPAPQPTNRQIASLGLVLAGGDGRRSDRGQAKRRPWCLR